MDFQNFATFIFFIAIISLLTNQPFMLNLLICLETLILSLIFLALTSLVSYAEPYIILSFLVLGACEASVGLALLVSFLRSQSNETINTTAASLW